jgi:hypothetical protein
MGSGSGTWKLVVPWVYKEMFLGKERGHFSPWLIAIFWKNVDLPQFALQVTPLNDFSNCC